MNSTAPNTPILIADDDQLSREMLATAVETWGYSPIKASCGIEALNILQGENAPRIAILDWMMPGADGPSICQSIRKRLTNEYQYLMLLTNRDQRKDRLAGFEAGADDFVAKPFDPEELRLRLRTGSRVVDLQDRLQAAHDALHKKATSDSLTGISNRGAILETLDREMARALRENSSIGLLVIDIDHFKQLNDNFGHPVGDVAIKHVAQCIQSATRPYDTGGRYGGDEFVVVLPNTNAAQAATIADRIRMLIESQPLPDSLLKFQLTVSVGAFATRAIPGTTTEELIQLADQALYQAKRLGRNQVATLRKTSDGQFSEQSDTITQTVSTSP